MALAIKLKEARRALGVTQRELSVLTGVTQATISRIESGDVSKVRPMTIMRLAKGLLVPEEYLGAGRYEMTHDERYRADKLFRNIVDAYTSIPLDKRKTLASFAEYLFDAEHPAEGVISTMEEMIGFHVRPINIERFFTPEQRRRVKRLLENWDREGNEDTAENDAEDDQ